MTLRTSRHGAGLLAVTMLLTAACTSGADARQESSATSSALSAAQVLERSRTVIDQASSMHLVLTSTGVPAGANGILRGEGVGDRQPGFSGRMTARLAGLEAEIPLVAIKDTVWAKLPIWPNLRVIDPATYGAPNPATLFSSTSGLSSLLPQTDNPVFGTERRDGADVVRPVSGTLSGAAVVAVLGIGDPTVQYRVEYLITADRQLRTATLRGKFFNDATSSYTLRLDQYGKAVDIKPPA